MIRTGGGIFYDRFQGNRVFDFVRNPPETVQPTLTWGLAQNIDPKTVLLGPPNVYAADPESKIPTSYNYQFSIQTRLPYALMLGATAGFLILLYLPPEPGWVGGTSVILGGIIGLVVDIAWILRRAR